MSNNAEVTEEELTALLEVFEKRSYEAGPCEEGTLEYDINKKCEILFKLDYNMVELDNLNGLLCPRYPARILIPDNENGHLSPAAVISNNSKFFSSSTVPIAVPASSTSSNNGLASSENSSVNSVQSFVTFSNFVNEQSNEDMDTAQPVQQQKTNQYQPEQELQQQQQQHRTIYEDPIDVAKIRDIISMAKYARCRQRFVVPVIMYRGKYICRSATVSVKHEAYGRRAVDLAYDCVAGNRNTARTNNDDDNGEATDESLNNQINETSTTSTSTSTSSTTSSSIANNSVFTYTEVINHDIRLLEEINVKTIVDLMVETNKVKFFLTVSSSEKADLKEFYKNFILLSMPYPGCEFFKEFRDNNYTADNLHYKWSEDFNNAALSLPSSGPTAQLDVNWPEYKEWDLVILTQNYLRAIFKYIENDNSGILVHCISGWDRTPLFISLIRMSLWADGLIHKSMKPEQMLYFTLAWDWYLFGHQLPDRLKRKEDILYFCFHMLKHIGKEEFSIKEHRKRTKTSSSSSGGAMAMKPNCDDIDLLKEDSLMSFDEGSNDSYSNGSSVNCDIPTISENLSVANANANPSALTNRSPNSKRTRTSPISVPGTRQRHESFSSIGSWQHVTDCGSLDSVANGSYMLSNAQRDNSVQSGNGIPINNGSSGNAFSGNGNGNENDSSSSNGAKPQNGKKATPTKRQQRFEAVRRTFIRSYGKIVGLQFKDGSPTTKFW